MHFYRPSGPQKNETVNVLTPLPTIKTLALHAINQLQISKEIFIKKRCTNISKNSFTNPFDLSASLFPPIIVLDFSHLQPQPYESRIVYFNPVNGFCPLLKKTHCSFLKKRLHVKSRRSRYYS